MTDEQVYDDNKWLMAELQAARYEIARLTAERNDWLTRYNDAQLLIERQSADLAAARAALQEIWESIPGSYDGDDPMVKRHAQALNDAGGLLSRLDTGKKGYHDTDGTD